MLQKKDTSEQMTSPMISSNTLTSSPSNAKVAVDSWLIETSQQKPLESSTEKIADYENCTGLQLKLQENQLNDPQNEQIPSVSSSDDDYAAATESTSSSTDEDDRESVTAAEEIKLVPVTEAEHPVDEAGKKEVLLKVVIDEDKESAGEEVFYIDPSVSFCFITESCWSRFEL